jgi:hypothetical protein
VSEILALIEVEGKLKIARGAVFSYYEFPWPASDRLTDVKWHEMLTDEDATKRPKTPAWVEPLTLPCEW